MQKIRGPIERIDDPGVSLVRTLLSAALLSQEPIARAGAAKLLAENLFCAMIRGADEVCGSLERHLQVFDLAKVALETARRFACGGNHDVDEGRAQHRDYLVNERGV